MSRSRVGTIECARTTIEYASRSLTVRDRGSISIQVSPKRWRERRPPVLTEKAWKKDASYTPTRGQKMLKPVASTNQGDLGTVARDHQDGPRPRSSDQGDVQNTRQESCGSGPRQVEAKRTYQRRAPAVDTRAVREVRPVDRAQHLQHCLEDVDDAMGEEWIDLPANPTRHPKVRAALPAVEAPEDVRHFTGVQGAHPDPGKDNTRRASCALPSLGSRAASVMASYQPSNGAVSSRSTAWSASWSRATWRS